MIEVEVRDKVLEFPDGTPEAEIESTVLSLFPPTDEETYNHLRQNPQIPATLEQFRAYNRHGDNKVTDWGQLFADGFSAIGDIIKEGAKAELSMAFDSTPQPLRDARRGKIMSEAGLRGTSDIGLIVQKGLFNLSNNLPEILKDENKQLEAFNFVRSLESARNKMAMGESAITDLVNVARDFMSGGDLLTQEGVTATGEAEPLPELLTKQESDAAEFHSLYADPSAAVPGTGALSKFSKPIVAAPVRAAGAAVRRATGAAQRGIDAVAGGLEGVARAVNPNIAEGAVRGGLIPAAAQGALETARAVGEVTEEVAKEFVNPRRAPAFSRIAQHGSGVSKGIAYAARPVAPVVDLTMHAASGGLEGAAIGGLLGYIADGSEGAVQGAGGGALLGLTGGTVSHMLDGVSGSRYAAGVANEWREASPRLFGDDLDPANSFADKLSPQQKGALLDMATHMSKTGRQVRFVRDGDSIPGGAKASWFKGAFEDDSGNIYLNIDRADITTAPHEFVHYALAKTMAGNATASVRNLMFGFDFNGNRFVDPVMSRDTVAEFSSEYAKRTRDAGNETHAKEFEEWARTALDETADQVSRLEAQNKVSEEMFAFMIGDKFGRSYGDELNPDHIGGLRAWAGDHMRAWFSAHKDAYTLKFEKGLEGAFTEVAKDPRVERVIKEVFKDLGPDTPDKGRTRISLKKMTKPARDKFVRDTPAAREFFNDDGTAKNPADIEDAGARNADRMFNELDAAGIGVKVLNDDGTTSLRIDQVPDPAALERSIAHYTDSTKGFIRAMIDGLQRDAQPTYIMSYFKASGERKGRRKPYDQFEISHREILPFRIEVNKTGGTYVRGVNMTKVRNRLKGYNSKHGKLFDNDAHMMRSLKDYLTNLTPDAPLPSADVLGGGSIGAKRRNFFHEAIGTVPTKDSAYANLPREGYIPQNDGTFQSFRVERITALTPTQTALPFRYGTTYRHSQVNFQPSRESRRSAMRYARDHKLRYQPNDGVREVPPARQKQLREIHDKAKHEPKHPKVRESYGALKKSLKEQYEYLSDGTEVRYQPSTLEALRSSDNWIDKFVLDSVELANFAGSGLPSLGGYDTAFHINTKIRHILQGYSPAILKKAINRQAESGNADAVKRLKKKIEKTSAQAEVLRGELADYIAAFPEMKGIDRRSGESVDPISIAKKHFPNGDGSQFSRSIRNIAQVVDSANGSRQDVYNLVELAERHGVDVPSNLADDISKWAHGMSRDEFAKANAAALREIQNPEFYDTQDLGGGASISTPIDGNIRYQPIERYLQDRPIPDDHPLAEPAGIELNGRQLTYDDLLTITHNVYGRSQHGHEAGVNSFLDHASLFPEKARAALAAETLTLAEWEKGGDLNAPRKAYVVPKRVLDSVSGLKKEPLPDTRYQPSTKHLMENPNFRSWFEGAELKEKDGSPKFLYHGTRRDVTQFKPGYADGLSFFSEDPSFASEWGMSATRRPAPEVQEMLSRRYEDRVKREREQKKDWTVEDWERYYGSEEGRRDLREQDLDRRYGGSVIPVVINAKKIFDPRKHFDDVKDLIDRTDWKEARETGGWVYFESPQIVNRLKERGYDAMRISEDAWNKDFSTIAIWDNRLVKSALANTTFDPTSSDIRYMPSLPKRVPAPVTRKHKAKEDSVGYYKIPYKSDYDESIATVIAASAKEARETAKKNLLNDKYKSGKLKGQNKRKRVTLGTHEEVSRFPYIKLHNKAQHGPVKITGGGTVKNMPHLVDAVNEATAMAAEMPSKGLGLDEWVPAMTRALDGSGAVIPPPPTRFAEWAKDPSKFDQFVADHTGNRPEILQSAIEGMTGVAENHSRAMRGELPTEATALTFLWGILSRRAKPIDQEGAWIKLSGDYRVLDAIADSIDGVFTMDKPAWERLVKEAIPESEVDKVGRGVISNANDFHKMLNEWNGRWDELNSIMNDASMTGQDMRRAMMARGFREAGTGHKVNSFIIDVLARPDLFIGDRWQHVNGWIDDVNNAAAFRAAHRGGDPVAISKRGGSPMDTTGAYAVMGPMLTSLGVAEAGYSLIEGAFRHIAENSKLMRSLPPELRNALGVHWISWNAIKQEPVGHSSLDSLKRFNDNFGNENWTRDFAGEQKFTEQYNQESGLFEVYGQEGGRTIRSTRSPSGRGGENPQANPQGGDGSGGRVKYQPPNYVPAFGDPVTTPQGRMWSNGESTVLQKNGGKLRVLSKDGTLLGVAKNWSEAAKLLKRDLERRRAVAAKNQRSLQE